jgi:hypothetical protein
MASTAWRLLLLLEQLLLQLLQLQRLRCHNLLQQLNLVLLLLQLPVLLLELLLQLLHLHALCCAVDCGYVGDAASHLSKAQRVTRLCSTRMT